MKKRLKTHSALIALSVLLFLLTAAGCEDDQIEKTREPVTLRVWHIYNDPASRAALSVIGMSYRESHPDVRIEITNMDNIEYKPKLDLQLAAGDPPEIFHSWGGGGLAEKAEAGYLKDITDWVRSGDWPVSIKPEIQNLYSWNDRIYGFPHDLGAVGFWYNKELLEKSGHSDFPEDWNSLLALLDDLKAEGITPVSLGMSDQWTVMYYWVYLAIRIGGVELFSEIMAGERTFEDPALMEAGRMMQDFYRRGYLQDSHIGDNFLSQSRQMGDGTCAMQLMGQWALAVQAQASDRKDELSPLMAFAPFPTVPGGIGRIGDAMGGGNGFVVSRGAPEEAVNFLGFFVRPDNLQKLFDAFPAVPTVSEVVVESPSLKLVRDYVMDAEAYALYPDQLFPREIGALLNEMSTRIMLAELTPEEGCREMARAWESHQDR